MKKIRTAECITPNHPDKICDRISDAILDECLRQDPESRVAVETMGGHGKIYITGELTTDAILDIPAIVLRTYGRQIDVTVNLVQQSNYIAQGVDIGGAGDQGIMVGYACNENPEMIPQELYLARSLCKEIFKVYPYDGKTQITLENDDIKTIVASFQNAPTKELERIIKGWLRVNSFPADHNVTFHCNPAGEWSVGGFDADAGVTGRKLVVDNYGPRIPIGGGAFSGKDSSKVDRSAAYMARCIAVSTLQKLSRYSPHEVYVYLAYAIGYDQPVQSTVIVDGQESEITGYDLSPRGIIEYLDLKNPKFEKTAEWGHMGTDQAWG